MFQILEFGGEKRLMTQKQYSIDVGGKTLTAEFSDLADQTNGSVMIRYGNTIVFATAVMSKYEREDADFFPLTVDFEEKFYAAGKILGSRFQKREGRPTDEAILSGRIVDRTIRPLFPDHLRHDVQVVITVLSIQDDDPDVLAIIAASLAIGVSDIPWNGPVSGVRIGKHLATDELEINPTYASRNSGDYVLDLLSCGTGKDINMIEVGAHEITEKTIMLGLKGAIDEIKRLQEFQAKIIKEIGKGKKNIPKPELPEAILKLFKEKFEHKLFDAVFAGPGKKLLTGVKDEWLKEVETNLGENFVIMSGGFFEEKINDLIHNEIIDKENRPDGRKLNELRPIHAKAGGISPIHHGAGIFYRGGTHVLSVLTLGGPGDAQLREAMEMQDSKRFMHHYNFPPFSTGETGRLGGLNRRMVGHGALAEKALEAVIPPKEKFPYTIRVVSESMASNGSTSMGSACAGTLALMDGGVPIKAPVAGIAVGLMMRSPEIYKILTDIQGPEDHHGDMDFKVAGTREGVTAIQLDVKVSGIPLHVLEDGLKAAKEARLNILEVIEKEIPKPRSEISPFAPEILTTKIKKDQIGLVIGTGGKTINEIKDKTGAEIDIAIDGTVTVTGRNGGAKQALEIIQAMTKEYQRGESFKGIVTKITDFGAFVEIGPGTEGLVHISEIAPFRIDRVEKYLKLDEVVSVIIKDIDEKNRIKLSIKDIDPDFAKRKTTQ